VGDLKQEIAAGSVVTTNVTGGVTNILYFPTNNTTAIPYLSGFTMTNGLENVVKVSKYGNPFFPTNNAYNTNIFFPSSRAAAMKSGFGSTILSTTNTSLNGRFMTRARWNKPLLLPPTSTNDYTPTNITATVFPGPDWILVSRSGSNPNISYVTNGTAPVFNTNNVWSTTNLGTVIGRYAYIIYNEGGLLDANVAGYPLALTNSAVTNPAYVPYKGGSYFADLTQIGLTTNQITALVGWRNYASGQASGTFPYSNSFTTDNGTNYAISVLQNTNGFLSVSTNSTNGYTDHEFTSRQQLISFLLNVDTNSTAQSNAIKALPYLGTFSRALEQPSYAPPTNRPKVLAVANGGNSAAPDGLPSPLDDKINPSFLTVRVANTYTNTNCFGIIETRSVGEPLVKKKFPLNRLAWLTYKGPSANRTQTDADIQALTNNGIPWSYLQLGTTNNIAKSFGLSWDSANNQWKYDQHLGTNGNGAAGAIKMLPDIAALSTPRDPDFFELLKASINVGSLGKALLPSGTTMPQEGGAAQTDQPYNYNYYLENSVDVQILKIGANIISQYQTANFPPRIVFDDGSGTGQMPTTIVGVANLPYLSSIITGAQLLKMPDVMPRGLPTTAVNTAQAGNSLYLVSDTVNDPGVGAAMQYPVVWNPHDPRSSAGVAGAGPTQFRVVADSSTPDKAEKGVGQYNIYTYAASDGSGSLQYSYNANAASPNSSWYLNPSSRSITAANTEIDFTAPASTAQIFPEPAMLLKPGTVTDSAGNAITVAAGAGNAISGTIGGSTFVTMGGLPDKATDGSLTAPPYVGFYLGAFPLAWYYDMTKAPLSAGKNGFYVARDTGGGAAGTTTASSYKSCYMTYRMQYKDPIGNWVTYDTKYGKTFDDKTQISVNSSTVNTICGQQQRINDMAALPPNPSDAGLGGFWASCVDPRTSRFGLLWTGTAILENTPGINSPFKNYIGNPTYSFFWEYKPIPAYIDNNGRPSLSINGGWIDRANATMITMRPDSAAGWYIMSGWPYSVSGSTSSKISPANDGTANGWMAFLSKTGEASSFPGINPGMLAQNNADAPTILPKYYADNGWGDSSTFTPQYFADPDGVVRRGMGAFIPPGNPPNGTTKWPAKTSVGQPMAQCFSYVAGSVPTATLDPSRTTAAAVAAANTTQMQSRPFMLHRPFYTVAELGYVFSDTPWRNLDFSTAESGSSALLDTFCIAETSDPTGLVAGKVDLNTRQTNVLQAVLASGYFDASQPAISANSTAKIDTNTAALLTQALTTRTKTNPLQNLTELVGRFVSKTQIRDMSAQLTGGALLKGTLSSTYFSDGKLSYSGFSDAGWDTNALAPLSSSPAIDVYSAYQNSSVFTANANFNGTKETISNIQRFREAPIRALAASGQTRVWNLMVDVIAQTGRYPMTATNISSFMVEGEQRYWVHLAIDRLTGQVIDKQVEVVKE
jgi:hypothetical protein